MDNKRKLSLRKASFLSILQDNFINKLPIPQAFINTFEGEIPPWFILEITGTRKCWRVDIEHDENGSLFLGYGFDCFLKAVSLEKGNFLLFEHVNPSILEVKIYEKDGSERTSEKTFESNYEVGAASESPTEIPIIQQEVIASPCNTSHTMTPVLDRPNKKLRGAIGNSGSGRGPKCIVSASEHGGLCFSTTWRKANHFLYYLTIPKGVLSGKSFANKKTITVKDGEGNSWQMEIRQRLDGRLDFARGWREFVEANDLRNGDTLTFEFVSDNVVQVHVKRASQGDQEGINQPSENFGNFTCEDEELTDVCTPSDKAPLNMGEMEGEASTLKSSFSFTWTHKTRHIYLHIPKTIANTQKLEKNDIVILCDPRGKQWIMEVKTRDSDGRVGLGPGWSNFTREYGFQPGDTLIFEFITDRMLKVNVVKACELDHPNSRATVKQEV